MTEIQSLRDELREYHGEVVRFAERLDGVTKAVDRHEVVLDGPPANGERPGLISRMLRVEWYQRLHLKCIVMLGAAVLGVIGTVVAAVVQQWLR